MEPLRELEAAYAEARRDPAFRARARRACCATSSAGPRRSRSPARLSERLGCRVWLKREDLCHTGAHKINNALGPGPAREAHGQDARGRGDRRRPARRRHRHRLRAARPRVRRLHGHRGHGAPGAERRAHAAAGRGGARRRLRRAHAQGRDQRGDARLGHERAHHALPAGLGAGRASVPDDGARFPGRDRRARRARRCSAQAGALPDLLVACVGGGSNAIGLFYAFLDDPVAMVGVEAGGRSSRPGRSRRALPRRRAPAVGVLHGTRTYLLQDEAGNVLPTHSVSAGLDYPAVGPGARAAARRGPRALRRGVSDDEALAAFHLLARDGGDHPRAGVRPRRWPGSCREAALARAAGACSSTSAAAATRTSADTGGRSEPQSVSRIAERLAAVRARRKKAFVAFVTAGDPSLDRTVEVALRARARRAWTSSSWACRSPIPLADGPVIQRASERALARGHAGARARGGARASARRATLPLLLFSYFNPLLRYGLDAPGPRGRGRRASTACW